VQTILVTGGAGFIGSHTCEELLKNCKVICIDNFNDYYDPKFKRRNISTFMKNPNFMLYETEILNFEAIRSIFEKNKIDKIVHLAARAGVRASIQDPKLYYDVNVTGTANILELGRHHKIRTVVIASSSSVYGDNTKIPFSENDITEHQISPYASTKKMVEILAKSYSQFGLNTTCLRFFTVYGPRGRPDMAPFKFLEKISKKEPIEMFGDGNSKRDYTYVTDVVAGIISALDRNFRYEIFNLGNSHPVKLSDFISTIEDVTGKKAKIIKKPMPASDVPITYADLTKSKRMLGYYPKISLEEGIKLFNDWYEKHSNLGQS